MMLSIIGDDSVDGGEGDVDDSEGGCWRWWEIDFTDTVSCLN